MVSALTDAPARARGATTATEDWKRMVNNAKVDVKSKVLGYMTCLWGGGGAERAEREFFVLGTNAATNESVKQRVSFGDLAGVRVNYEGKEST